MASGYVLTGGIASMPGVLDLAYDILHENVRVATPDYIGVREPQYTSGVGLIKHSYQKLNYVGKMQEKQEHFEPVPAPAPTPVQQQPTKQKLVIKTIIIKMMTA